MIAALLPVKAFDRSKQRLAGFLTPAERVLLARTMFEDVWAALQQACAGEQRLDRLLVISAEPFVLARCRESGIPCLEESEQVSHSESVNAATRWAVSLGATSLLSVPIDTPGVTAQEILSLLDVAGRAPVVIVPSGDGTGTNALLRTPPDVIDACFGPDSCRRYVQEAERKGVPSLVFPSPGLMGDIDTPEDLRQFASQSQFAARGDDGGATDHQDGRVPRTLMLARQLLAADRGAEACR